MTKTAENPYLLGPHIQSNLPYATTQNVKTRWSLTGGGRLREFGPYWVRILAYGNCRDLPMFYMFYSNEKSILRKTRALLIVLSRNVIVLQHFIIQFPLYRLPSGRLREVTKENFKL